MSRTLAHRMPAAQEVHKMSQAVESRETAFARRLQALMAERNLSNSELARRVWGEITNSRGYKEAKGRDRIGKYIKGETYPEPRTLKEIADALGVGVPELAPDGPAKATPWEAAETSLLVLEGHPGKALLRIDKILPFAKATRILQILAEPEAEEECSSES